MWVWIDASLKGFPHTSTVSPAPNPVLATKGERSDIEFLLRDESVKKPIASRTSELLERLKNVRLVNPAKADISDIVVEPKNQQECQVG